MTSLNEIERDLKAFADPWSTVIVDASTAVWEREGRVVSVRFAASTSGAAFPDVIVEGVRLTYKAFLAGPHMANLASFADFIVKTYASKQSFVETDASLIDDAGTEVRTGPAVELIRERTVTELPFMSTRVVLVRGEAGSGKTVLLREATARQAAKFRQGEVGSLYFLVDAQGRALSRLEDAMARDLQDLRASFPYAAVAALTRHQLLVPIIDGFDELLGSGGYEEAFSSLAAFLATLDGQGSVVASARSAFFDYRNFFENASRFSADGRLNYQVDVVGVVPWNHAQVREYVASFAQATQKNVKQLLEQFDDVSGRLKGANRDLLSKPFYAARVAELVASHSAISEDEDLLDQLIEAFVAREHGKLLDKDGRPLLSVKGHRDFLTALAEEMWWQENRRLDVATVQAAAELITEKYGLPSGASKAIVERVSSYAFLSADGTARKALRFEHEVFYGYFLAQKLREYVEGEDGELRRFLARSVVEPTLVEQLVRLLGADGERGTKAVEAVAGVLRPNMTDLVSRQNAGAIIAAICRQNGKLRDGAVLANVIFGQECLGPLHARSARFVNCEFNETDFSQVRLFDVTFTGCALRNVTVDMTTTRLEGMNADAVAGVQGLHVRSASAPMRNGRVFAPDELLIVLVALGMHVPLVTVPASTRKSIAIEERVDVLERFLRKMERRFYAAQDDIDRFAFSSHRQWSRVLTDLRSHGLLSEHFVQKSGPGVPLFRLTFPPEVVRRGENPADNTVPDSVRQFWVSLTTDK